MKSKKEYNKQLKLVQDLYNRLLEIDGNYSSFQAKPDDLETILYALDTTETVLITLYGAEDED